MITIFHYLKDYIASYYNWKLYTATLVFIAILIFFNFKYEFEDSVIDSFYGSNIRILWFFLLHAIPYYLVCLFLILFTDNKDFIRQKAFWIISVSGFLVLSIDRGGYYGLPLAEAISVNVLTFTYFFKVIGKWMPVATNIIPLLLLYLFFQRKQLGHFYGIQRKNVNLKPYFIILLIMIPVIAAVSFQPDFLREYPNYQRSGGTAFAEFFKINEKPVIAFYEFSYLFVFFVTELFFRGFLIFGLVKYLGKDVVLPMAVTYCILHFGKPVGEAVSSFFGGYILGVVALETENISGGIIVHMGIALLMEIFAFWQM